MADRVTRWPRRRSDAGGGDGLPSTPSGEPLLARWFVLGMIPLVLLAVVVTVWMFLSFGREPLTVAERRPPGDATVTHDRGAAVLNEVRDTEPAGGCAQGVTLVGDVGARASVGRALRVACQLLASGRFPAAEAGLDEWVARDGTLRVAVFERTGLESSARVEDDHVVVELSPRYQVEDATRAAPFVIHELTHIAGDWPGEAVGAADELAAQEATARACALLVFRTEPPLGCADAEQLVADPDALRLLRDAGYG